MTTGIAEDNYLVTHNPDADLVVHQKRPQWGVAMLTWEGNDRRRYQFQDGRLRTFKDGFYHMLETVDVSQAAQTTLREDLERKHGMSLQDREAERAREKKAPVMSFSDQLRVFRHLFEEGFQTEDYIMTFRNREGRTRLKRLVDPAIQLAQEKLSREAMSARIEAGDWTGLMDDVFTVLKRTSLASPTKVVKPLKALDETHLPRLARALFDLLYGDPEVKYSRRFREWVMALDAEGSVAVNWPMATVLPALVLPEEHVCVRRKAFRLQARSVAPDARVGKHPSPRGYKRARRIAKKTRAQLVENDFEPRDLFDVRQFIWETLRPKGQETLDDLRTPGL